MVKTKTILDIDNPTKNQIRRALTHHKPLGSLYVPEELHETLTEYCRCGCGRPLANVKLMTYFGERFCSDAVERWQAGAK